MSHINYFRPYESKKPNHEDQLTRAYLVLLRYSYHALVAFYDYCKESQTHCQESLKLPAITGLLSSDWNFETQKRNPEINTALLYSVLITDKEIEKLQKHNVEASDRNAVYDGIITIGNEITFVIEVKPHSENAWFEQLHPSTDNLNDETQIVQSPIQLQWKEIIRQLNKIQSSPSSSPQERTMINDFLDFIDNEFPYLNPYDNFALCKNNEGLLYRRTENILNALSKDSSLVNEHRGWGYYIDTSKEIKEIHQIGLILFHDKVSSKWHVSLVMAFADIMSQAREFYKKEIDFGGLGNGWSVEPNFHVSFKGSGLVWFDSPDLNKYIQYWKSNPTEIRQRGKDDVLSSLQDFHNKGLIIFNQDKAEQMQEKYFRFRMSVLNFCPGLKLVYEFNSEHAEQVDKKHEFVNFLKDRIIEGFGIIGYKEKDLKNLIKL